MTYSPIPIVPGQNPGTGGGGEPTPGGGASGPHMAMLGIGDQYVADHPEITRTPGVSITSDPESSPHAFAEAMIGGTVISFYNSEGYVEAFTVTSVDEAVYDPTFFDGWALSQEDFNVTSKTLPLSSTLTVFLDYSGYSAGLYDDNEPRQLSLWLAGIVDGGAPPGAVNLASIARDRSGYGPGGGGGSSS